MTDVSNEFQLLAEIQKEYQSILDSKNKQSQEPKINFLVLKRFYQLIRDYWQIDNERRSCLEKSL